MPFVPGGNSRRPASQQVPTPADLVECDATGLLKGRFHIGGTGDGDGSHELLGLTRAPDIRRPSSRGPPKGMLPTLTWAFRSCGASPATPAGPGTATSSRAATPSGTETRGSGTPLAFRPGSSVSLAERMNGSALKRHPPDVGRLHTALLIGGSKQVGGARRSIFGGEPSPEGASAPSNAVRHHIERSCCTPAPDATKAKREAQLEALLTAGDYEELFNGAPTVDDVHTHGRDGGNARPEQDRTVTAQAVAGELTRFDARQRSAMKAALIEARQRDAELRRSGVATPSKKSDTHHGSWSAHNHVAPAGSTAAPSMFAPPQVIQLVFRFGSVRNLPATQALKRVGYPELHEQFSVAASSTGVVYKSQYLEVLKRYLTVHERADALRILDCFAGTGNGHGDVPLPSFLVGLQMLLECATPGDTLRFCFQLLGASDNVPRYVTRYEAQTLVTYADEAAAGDAKRGLLRAAYGSSEGMAAVDAMSTEQLVERCGDKHYLTLRRQMLNIIEDASRYDYSGRMPLKDFLNELDDKVQDAATSGALNASPTKSRHQAAAGVLSATNNRSAAPRLPGDQSGNAAQVAVMKRESPFVFGRVWQGGGGAMIHRMSSKKMIIASLSPSAAPAGPQSKKGDALAMDASFV